MGADSAVISRLMFARGRPCAISQCKGESTMATGFSGLWRKGALLGIVLALAVVFGVILAGCGAARDPNASAFSSEVVAQKAMISADAGGAPKWDKATYDAQAVDITFV